MTHGQEGPQTYSSIFNNEDMRRAQDLNSSFTVSMEQREGVFRHPVNLNGDIEQFGLVQDS